MNNPTVVITGGTKGIGKALVELFASQKFDIITCARNEEALQQLQKDITATYKVNFFYQSVDLANKEAVLNFAQFVQTLHRPIDVLINNAGYFEPSMLTEESHELFEKTMHVNVFGVYYLTKALLPLVKQSSQAHIFNICSIASNTILPNCGAYGVSKFALLGMTKILREELKTQEVKVTAVLPGATFTAAWDGSNINPERIMPAEEIAKAVWNCFNLSGNVVVEELTLRPQLGDL